MTIFSPHRLAVALAVLAGTAVANPAHDILAGMSEAKQRETLAGLLTNSGERCPSVTRVFFQGSAKNGDAFWNAQCSTGQAFSIQINNDSKGSTRLLDCKVLKAVGGGTCFKKF